MTENPKGIIACTSWVSRIHGVALTLYSLVKQCRGFNVVLTLSSDEFPNKEDDLPKELRTMNRAGVIRIIWVKKNYKPFKKVLFAMQEYPDLPIISADDDCIYRYNYAEELYSAWEKNKKAIIAETVGDGVPWGYATLHPPKQYDTELLLRIADYCLDHKSYHDDLMFKLYAKRRRIPIISMNHFTRDVVIFHNGQHGLFEERMKRSNDWSVVNAAFSKLYR